MACREFDKKIMQPATLDLKSCISQSKKACPVLIRQAFQITYTIYTATLCSLKASFNDVLRSVLSLRFPIIRAQGTW